MKTDVPVALRLARGAVALALCGTAFSPPLVNVALAVALFSFLTLPDIGMRLRQVLRQPVAQGALLLWGVLALAMLWSDVDWAQRLHALTNWRTLLLLLLVLALFSSTASKARAAAVFVGFAVLGALASLLTWVINVSWIPTEAVGTVLRNPSTQSMVFVTALTLATVQALNSTRSLRVLYALAALLLALNLLFVTTGRSGQIAALIAAVTLTWTLAYGRLRMLVLGALPLLVLAIVLVSPVLSARFMQGWQEMQSVSQAQQQSSMGMRVVIWRHGWEVVQAQPWWGHGLGAVKAAYIKQLQRQPEDGAGNNAAQWRATPTADLHNQYLTIAAAAGVLGLSAFGVFLIAAAYQPAARPWKQAALTLLLAWSATSLFSSHFQTFAEGHLLLLWLGVLLAPRLEQPS